MSRYGRGSCLCGKRVALLKNGTLYQHEHPKPVRFVTEPFFHAYDRGICPGSYAPPGQLRPPLTWEDHVRIFGDVMGRA